MSSSSGPGSTGLAQSGRVRITSRSQGSSAALVTVTAPVVGPVPEPEVPGVLGRVGGDLVEVFDVGPVAFGVAGNPVCQVLGIQDFPEGRVVDAVGGVLADLGQGRFPAESAPVVGFQFRVGGWTLGAYPGNIQPCSSWRHSGLRFVDGISME